ncbi:hypothetical protein BDV93DRAFT_476370, partial [Ceratobasidium sp. AG-I]
MLISWACVLFYIYFLSQPKSYDLTLISSVVLAGISVASMNSARSTNLPTSRHRIQEITLKPEISKRPVVLEIHVDGRKKHTLAELGPGQPLRWDMRLFPCDVHSNSNILVKIIERRYMSPDQVRFLNYHVSNSATSTPIERITEVSSRRGTKQIIAVVRFPDPNEVEAAYAVALSKAETMIGRRTGPLEILGDARVVLEAILGFSRAIAELNPAAKSVFAVCAIAWEYLVAAQQRHEALQRLIDDLVQLCPVLETAREHAKEYTQQAISDLLNLIEDASNLIVNCLSDKTLSTRVFRIFVGKGSTEQINALLLRFDDLKGRFDRALNLQILDHTITSAQRNSIDRLAPAVRSHYATITPCLEGTRQQILNDIRAWSGNQASSNNLLWVFGQAGLGKSSIAATLCKRYDEAGTLGSYFFCKRDDPELRSPEHILNTIVHRLATRFKPYGKAVAHAIENNSQLPELPFEQRYTCLVEQPIHDLESNNCRPSSMLFLVVDALDECEKDGNRRALLKCLRAMSQAIPWLKVILTSRPDPDIRAVFGKAEDAHVSLYDLLQYDATNDILEFTRRRMAGIANDKTIELAWLGKPVQLLSERAGGLFIWVETACKFIERGADMETRLEQILQGTQPAEGSKPLDLLYT